MLEPAEEEEEDDTEDELELVEESAVASSTQKEKKRSAKDDNKISAKLGYNRYLRNVIWKVWEESVKLDNLSNTRKHRKKWPKRKKSVKSAMERLHWESKKGNEIKEETSTPDTPWTRLIKDLHPGFYR